jgi:hypothetical protein
VCILLVFFTYESFLVSQEIPCFRYTWRFSTTISYYKTKNVHILGIYNTTVPYIIIQGLHKITVRCWTSIIQDSWGIKQWKWQNWIPSLKQFFSHTWCVHLIVTQGHDISVSVWSSLAPLHAVDNVYRKRKIAMCLVVRGNKIISKCSA